MYVFVRAISWRIFPSYVLTAFLLICCITADAQKKWDGEGLDGQWANALNWSDNQVPQISDDVELDHSFIQGHYSVWLPAGSSGVSAHRIFIHPTSGMDSIKLIIPNSSLAIPALQVAEGGIRLAARACLVNASGAPGGTAVSVADSIYIEEGAKMIHNTRNAHAAYISRLSQSPGTEKGIFVFDVPGTASYTVSLSGRVYGSLHLLSAASVVGRTYISTGANTALIRGDLVIGEQVNYSLDFTGTLDIRRNWQVQGIMNLASSGNKNIIKVRGDIECTGSLTESSSGNPVIECCGNNLQQLDIRGGILNSITLRQNNPAGCKLLHTLGIPWRLELIAGPVISSEACMLELDTGCTVAVDSSSSVSFIDGPVLAKKMNGSYFHFPIGKSGKQRWLSLRGATGDIIAEYVRTNPTTLSSQLDSSLAHISSLEYWRIKSSTNAAAIAELSFDDLYSGGVTDCQSLRVACFSGDFWVNAGNLATTGTAGAAGSVVGDTMICPASAWQYLTLGSELHAQNPLPHREYRLTSHLSEKEIELLLEMGTNREIDKEKQVLILESSAGNGDFHKMEEIRLIPVSMGYRVRLERPAQDRFYRMRLIPENGPVWVSAVIAVKGRFIDPGFDKAKIDLIGVSPGIVNISLSAEKPGKMDLVVADALGNRVMKKVLVAHGGNQSISLQIGHLPAGIYRVFGVSSSLRTNPINFFKP